MRGKSTTMNPGRDGVLAAVLLLALVPASANAACAPPSQGAYTAAQAAAGQPLYDKNCSSCHAVDLTGGSGPALTGKNFVSYLQFTKITGAQLLSFISTQMPYNAPGSLSATDYQSIFAYILKINHYKAGSTALDATTIGCVQMLPYPAAP
jgi:mono/diheme cytochrome c family protein